MKSVLLIPKENKDCFNQKSSSVCDAYYKFYLRKELCFEHLSFEDFLTEVSNKNLLNA